MSWGLLDDKLHVHPKFAMVGLEATGLWTLCLSYVNDALTEGFVPRGIVARFAGGLPKAKKLVAELVAAGLWHEVEGGWRFHDYLDYNFSGEEARKRRAEVSRARSEAGRRGAEKRWGKAAATDAPSEPDATGKPEGRPSHTNGKGDFCHAGGMANTWQPHGPKPVPKPGTRNTPGAIRKPPASPTAAALPGGPGGAEPGKSGGGGGGGEGSNLPPGWEDAEALEPEALLCRYREAFPEREPELAQALGTATRPVGSQAAYLRPVILRRLRGQEAPAPITPTAPADTRPAPALPGARQQAEIAEINARSAGRAQTVRDLLVNGVRP